MNLTRCLAASLITMSLAGCCCGRNVVMDSCDPCAPMVRQSCGHGRHWLVNWFRGRGCQNCCGCSSGCGAYGDVIEGGCSGGCDCGGYGSSDVNINGMPSSGGGCACGQTAPMMPGMSMPSSPAMGSPTYDYHAPVNSIPTQIPTAPAPPPVPSASNDQTTMIPPSPSPSLQMQTVTYEEFQRLPGTVVSGPGSTMAAAPNSGSNSGFNEIQRTSAIAPSFLPPPASATPPASRPVSGSQNRQAIWIPAKGY